MNRISRRNAMRVLAAGAPAVLLPRRGQAQIPEIAKGPYQGTRESLQACRIPDWFRDAKFGIWAHWGPQSAPEQGDWYAQRMYLEGKPVYKWHLEHFGHPSKVGFKDVIPTFKAEKWDPEHLMDLYAKAGAKYFVSMGVHHDNFDMWNSKHQPRWNAAAAGPKKDIVGIWRDCARKRGLKFGVSEHLSNSFDWFAPAHRSDKEGPFAGLPYDGTNPQYADLYHDYSGMPPGFEQTAASMGRVAPDPWKRQYFLRIQDLIDQHQPDLLYTDGGISFEEYGLSLVAHLYNSNAQRHGGKVQAVYASKARQDCAVGTCALDLERGIVDKIWPDPWQTDTCIGDWHYKRDIRYKSPKTVIDMLVDIVSKNGNLLLNFPLPGSGEPDERELAILAEIAKWMAVNSEGIYNTRPWKRFGDGPSTQPPAERQGRLGFNESGRKELTAEDVRFTSKGKTLYAFIMGWPEKEAVLRPDAGKVRHVDLLGFRGKVKWLQDASGLRIQMPAEKPCDHAIALKISLA